MRSGFLTFDEWCNDQHTVVFFGVIEKAIDIAENEMDRSLDMNDCVSAKALRECRKALGNLVDYRMRMNNTKTKERKRA